jgi:glycosyltransferase involved in cell wall biosynthesis
MDSNVFERLDGSSEGTTSPGCGTLRTVLSICIATLNRGAFIGAALESIISQASEQIEIVVLDGGSTDNTEEVVGLYQERFPRIRYYRQSAKMGLDYDFAEAVRLAAGEYCWLFSDDDVLKPGAIDCVLDAIKGQYSLIIANAEVCDANLSELLEPQRLPIKADRIYTSSESHRLLIDCGKYMTFIGCVIIKNQVWSGREKQKYFGSYFVHVGVIFQSPLPQDALVIAKPLISIRYGNAMWLGRYFEIWMFKWPELIWSFTQYPDSVKVQVCPKEPWRNVLRLLLHRAKGAYTKSAYVEWLEPRLVSRWTRGVSKGVAYFPGRIANFLGFVYYSIFSRHSARLLAIVDMENSPFYYWGWRKRRPSQPTLAGTGSGVSQ